MYRIIALVALTIILGLVNWSIAGKEKHLAEGIPVFLKLAPVDPRSIMQGDYMALRYLLANEVFSALPKKEKEYVRWRQKVDAEDGHVVVHLDKRGVGTFKRLYKGGDLSDGEILMRYRVRNGVVKFATNAFFFQEGQGKTYQTVRYGQFRVDDNGELLLVAMYDKNLDILKPNKTNE